MDAQELQELKEWVEEQTSFKIMVQAPELRALITLAEAALVLGESKPAERAVSPAESVQMKYDTKFSDLLASWGYAAPGDDALQAADIITDYIDTKIAAAYERGYDDGHIAGRDKGKRASTEEAHAEGRRSALEELHPQWLKEKERADRAEAAIAAAREEGARDKDGNHVDDLRGWLDEAKEQYEAQDVAFHACSLKLKQAESEIERLQALLAQPLQQEGGKDAKPYCYLYEWDGQSVPGVTRRSTDYCKVNGREPDRAIPLYTAPQPSDKLQQASKPNADCSGDPANCPDNEGYGCACSQPQQVDTGGLPG